jgi:transposase
LLTRPPNAPIATEALERIAALYRIEAEIRGLSPAERLAGRQARSQALITDLHAWFAAQHARLFTRGPSAEAIGHALNHWDGLVQLLNGGRIELDTNRVERSMRPVALSRKDALFAGSDEGGANWALGHFR